MKCNLTNKKIIYPVLGKDGYLYEHAEIIYYLIRNYKSPKTNEYMDIFDLLPRQMKPLLLMPFY